MFNKTDVQPHDFAMEWMKDFETFQMALISKSEENECEGGSGYMSSLMNSMSLVLDEFYKNLRVKSWDQFLSHPLFFSRLISVWELIHGLYIGCRM